MINLKRSWRKIKCKTGRHELRVAMVSPYGFSYKATCVFCNKSLAINDNLMVALPWDIEFERLAKFNGWIKV